MARPRRYFAGQCLACAVARPRHKRNAQLHRARIPRQNGSRFIWNKDNIRVKEVKPYLKNIEKQRATGRATEHTHRAALQTLIEAFQKGAMATNEPARIECGAPDYIVTRNGVPIGYVEAKDIGADLDAIERTPQLRRYLEGLPNLILTDYLEFRLYHAGEFVMEARLARPAADGALRPNKDGATALSALFEAFFSAQLPLMGTPQELAARMAATARLLHDVIRQALGQEEALGTLHGQLEAFRRVLLHDLEPEQFADMYAQTICYGLFAARCNHRAERGAFNREAAVFELPETNPFLRQMFGYIAGPELDNRLTWAVDQLVYVLDRAGMEEILRGFGRRTRQEDPVVHFYETFLAAYDPSLRETRGVYYTPEPVVSYIVRSVDAILKRDFGIAEGLACTEKAPVFETHQTARASKPSRKRNGEIHRVLILDPAVGTGTFLHGVVDQIHEAVTSRFGAGVWNPYVSEHLLPRLFGFELLMAPYAVAHMKLGIQLAGTGYKFQSGERLRVYLTNTLEEAFDLSGLPLFAHIIAEEANAAGRVKNDYPVMVVLGNPPYSGHSANNGPWIANLLRGVDSTMPQESPAYCCANYFMVDGQPLGERNPKWLNDDYVKFIRFAQWRIERTGYGILAFICNHGYLDNPTFRGMRQSLMEAFDDIYLLDLHGNAKKKETAPDGSDDKNVFDIQQGVAIGIFVKKKNGAAKKPATVRHAHLWGLREVYEQTPGGERKLAGGKYHTLYHTDINSTRWTKLKPESPFYLFIPQDTRRRKEYETGWKITDILPVNSVGLVTARDKLTIHWSREAVWETVQEFGQISSEEARERFELGKDAEDWQVSLAQEDIRSSGPKKECIQPVLYRPFDVRWTYYTGQSRGFICRPRSEVMRHMLAGENLGLISTRLTKEKWDAFCATNIIGHKALSAYDITYLFPLYLCLDNGDAAEDIEAWAAREEAERYGIRRKPNLSKGFVRAVAEKTGWVFLPNESGDLKKTFGPEDVFHYLYAVMHAPAYRSRYAEFLKMDFPRVPITSNPELFRALCGLGARLTSLHLLDVSSATAIGFPEKGDNIVEKPRYAAAQKRIYINDRQYFTGVSAEIWEFCIGGYQVCQKWLNDRKGRALGYGEIMQYLKIAGALDDTILIMAGIDSLIKEHGSWPLS